MFSSRPGHRQRTRLAQPRRCAAETGSPPLPKEHVKTDLCAHECPRAWPAVYVGAGSLWLSSLLCWGFPYGTSRWNLKRPLKTREAKARTCCQTSPAVPTDFECILLFSESPKCLEFPAPAKKSCSELRWGGCWSRGRRWRAGIPRGRTGWHGQSSSSFLNADWSH